MPDNNDVNKLVQEAFKKIKKKLEETDWEQDKKINFDNEGQAVFSLYDILFFSFLVNDEDRGTTVVMQLSTAVEQGTGETVLQTLFNHEAIPTSLDGEGVILIVSKGRTKTAKTPAGIVENINKHALVRFKSYVASVEKKIERLEHLKERKENVQSVIDDMESKFQQPPPLPHDKTPEEQSNKKIESSAVKKEGDNNNEEQ